MRSIAFPLVLTVGLFACSADSPTLPSSQLQAPEAAAAGGAATEMNRQLAAVRSATARFHDVDVALAEGYVSTHECASVPGVGAMGVHYVNPPLMGDASFDPLRPEVLVYEPRKDGGMRLVAVEYLIFRAPWEAAGNTTDPHLLDVPFVRSFGPAAHGLPDHYELHVWVWRHNPAGMFAQWNPKVSC